MSSKFSLALMALLIGVLANGMKVQSREDIKTCVQLLETNEEMNNNEKRNAELCQLIEMADNLNEGSKTLMTALMIMLDEEGVKLDKEDQPSENDVEKRKTEFLRFGKRKTEFLRFGKRKTEFLRFGKRKWQRFGRSE